MEIRCKLRSGNLYRIARTQVKQGRPFDYPSILKGLIRPVARGAPPRLGLDRIILHNEDL